MKKVDYTLFDLKQDFFDHKSSLHGINHTYRVMCLTMYISESEGLKKETLPALCAAFIHDLARKDDGYCTQHGSWSVKTKLPVFKQRFLKVGLTDTDITKVGKAVANHSVRNEFKKSDEAYLVTAILKDADALDRIRLGEDNLDEKYLRLESSRNFINFAKELFYRTNNNKLKTFEEVLSIAKQIKTKNWNYG